MNHPLVDLYLLEEKTVEAVYHKVCQLIYQEWTQQKNYYLYCSDRLEAKNLDDRLWTFKDISFIPHALVTELDAGIKIPGCVIGYPEDEQALANTDKILVHLANKIHPSFEKYCHIIDVVNSEPTARALARERYRCYKKSGYTIKLYPDPSHAY